MSSTTMRSLRQIQVTVRATEPSALARTMAVASDSRMNQATSIFVDRGMGEGLDEMELATSQPWRWQDVAGDDLIRAP